MARVKAPARSFSVRCVMNSEILIGVIMAALVLGGAFVLFLFT
ncbi:MAG TPA: hypothetical protein VGC20_00995 [bacterium]